MASPLDTTANPDRFEKYKVLYDLALKRWENSYSELPNQIRENGNKLITIMLASLAAIPSLVSNEVDTYKVSGVSASQLGIAGVLFITCCIFLALSFYYIGAVMRLDTFRTYSPTGIREQANNAATSVAYYHEILVNDLINLTEFNMGQYKKFVKCYKKAFYMFIIAVIAGLADYLYCLLIQKGLL